MQFDGQYSDGESGFLYLPARYYDPATGQFLSLDPQVSLTGEPYGYEADNPVNVADPSGLSWWNPFYWSKTVRSVVGTAATVVGLGLAAVGLFVAAPALAVGLRDLYRRHRRRARAVPGGRRDGLCRARSCRSSP